MAKAKGIYRRGNVYWIRYAGLDGRIVFESARTEKFREAEALLLKRKQSIKEGRQPEIVRKVNLTVTFSELAEEYKKWCERQRSFRSKEGFIKQLIQAFGNLQLRYFNTRLVEQYQTDRIQKGNKPATINRHIATLKHMFTKGYQWEMLTEDILKRVKVVKLLEENNRRLRFLSVEECRALINACDRHLKPIVITALNTGMRKGEILSLEWDRHVDLIHGFITLDVTKNGERREIPINETLKAVLRGLVRRLDVPHVFYDPNTGKPYQDVKKSFQTALRRAKIKDFVFHSLRHTFASHLVMAGVDLTTVSRLLGHKSLTMTLRYSHLAPSHMVKALDVLDSSLNEKANTPYFKMLQP
jgi:integrase